MTISGPRKYDLELQLANDGGLESDFKARREASLVPKHLNNNVGFSIGVDLTTNKITCIAWGGQPPDYVTLANSLIDALAEIAAGVAMPSRGNA